MDIEVEKKKIIREVLTLQDEWIIMAIKKLLDLDVDNAQDFSDEHANILHERMEQYKIKQTGTSLEEFIEELKAEGKL